MRIRAGEERERSHQLLEAEMSVMVGELREEVFALQGDLEALWHCCTPTF
jgi:hypothetical protein